MEKLQKGFKTIGAELLGWTLVIGGILLMPLPGPGSLILFAGVVVLSHRYVWAKKLKSKVQDGVVEGTKASVATKKRIAMSAVGAVCVISFGLWIAQDPTLPSYLHFDLWGLEVGPKIPGAGMGSGVFIVGSGVVSLILLAFGVAKFKD